MLPSFSELVSVFARIGCINFGGPAGQIALMHRILVDEKKWIGEARFLHALNYCMLLPGPEAQQLATYIGWLMHGWRGGLAAGALFILPGAIVMMALSAIYFTWADVTWLQAMFFGIKCAVLAIVVEALLRVARRALSTRAAWGVACAAFVALFFLAAPFPLIVASAALIGFVLGTARFSGGNHGKSGNGPEHGAIDLAIESGAINPGRRSLKRLAGTIGLWLALWLLPVGAIMALAPQSVFEEIALFFSQTAIVTFGGAYAVLSFVAQHAVATQAWLTAPEMLHGLALAETTPGPLILVLQFVGFLAAARDTMGLDPLVAGILGATLTLWVIFVPSFLMIFAGAPYAEALHDRPRLKAALAAITAAVVGVILNLSLWFALHVLFAEVTVETIGPLVVQVPTIATIDPAAAALTLAALIAVLRLKLGVVTVIATWALAGIGLSLVGL